MEATICQMSKDYNVYSQAAWAMQRALSRAETDEVLANDFNETARLLEIQTQLRQVETLRYKLLGGHDALWRLWMAAKGLEAEV